MLCCFNFLHSAPQPSASGAFRHITALSPSPLPPIQQSFVANFGSAVYVFYWCWLYMSPVSLVFHIIVTVILISKMYFEQTHLFYYIRYPCFNSWASTHTFSSQATQYKQIITPCFLLARSPFWSCFETCSRNRF